MTAALALKADKPTTYTITQVDNLLTPKANTVDVNAELALKADRTYVDGQLVLKADQSTHIHQKTMLFIC